MNRAGPGDSIRLARELFELAVTLQNHFEGHAPELLGHRHVTTTQIYDKHRRTTEEPASHEVPV